MRGKLLALVGVLGLTALSLAGGQEKGAKPDDEGFIRNWLVLEPIPLGDTAGTHEEETQKPMFGKQFFEGQKDGMPTDGTKVKVEDKIYVWHAHSATDYYVDFEKTAAEAGKEAGNALFLGVAYVMAPEQMDGVKLAIGSDDSSVWTVNGNEVVRVYAGRGVDKDQDTSEAMTLKKGVNVVRFAVINGEGPTGACARFLDKSGNAVTGITIMSAPPKKE